MKTAIILSTAFITTINAGEVGEERINQYIKGFNQIGEIVRKYPDFDIFVVDNTLENESKLDTRLISAISAIPNLKEKIFFSDNEYGKKNKGAGLIVAWKGFLSRLNEPYEYVISFEPRQKLDNFSFFERFVDNPNSYFKIDVVKAKKFRIFPITLHQILTGLVAFRRTEMSLYCESVDLNKMVNRKISIEDDLYYFLIQNKISFQAVDKLGVIWHDSANNVYIEL